MSRRQHDVAATERALERLFRLSMGRAQHTRQALAVGASVSRTAYAVLRTLDDHGELSTGAVAHECAMDPATAVRQIQALEDDGLVERSPAEDDARVRLVRLTRKGRATYRRIVAVRTSYLADVLDDWSAADCTKLARLLDRLVDDLRAVPFDAVARTRRS